MQECGFAVFIQGDHRGNPGATPLGVPDLAICFRVVDVDWRAKGFAGGVLDSMRLQVDFHVREIVFPFVGDTLLITGIEESLRIGRVFVVIVIGVDHVQGFAISAGDLGLVGGPVQFSLAIQIGDILLGAAPGSAIISADPVGPGTSMSIGPVIDHFPIVMNPVDGWVRDLGSDLRSSGPVDLLAISFDRLGRDEMGPRGLVAAKKYVQVVVFVGPDDRAVMMIAAPFLAQANRF